MPNCSNTLKGSHIRNHPYILKLHWTINLTLPTRLPRLTDHYRAMLSYIITILFHAHLIKDGRGQYFMKDLSQSIHPTRKLNLLLLPNHSNFIVYSHVTAKQGHCIIIMKTWIQALATHRDSCWMEFQWRSISISAVYPWTIIPPSIFIANPMVSISGQAAHCNTLFLCWLYHLTQHVTGHRVHRNISFMAPQHPKFTALLIICCYKLLFLLV